MGYSPWGRKSRTRLSDDDNKTTSYRSKSKKYSGEENQQKCLSSWSLHSCLQLEFMNWATYPLVLLFSFFLKALRRALGKACPVLLSGVIGVTLSSCFSPGPPANQVPARGKQSKHACSALSRGGRVPQSAMSEVSAPKQTTLFSSKANLN